MVDFFAAKREPTQRSVSDSVGEQSDVFGNPNEKSVERSLKKMRRRRASVFAKRQSFAFQCRARAAAAMSRAPREAVRPEERAGGDADKYYDREVTEAYTELNVRTQSELTTRCLDMLCLEDDAREEVLLDIGCGSGLSGETLTRHGYRAWVGIDASAAMLERATRGRSAPKRTADEKERRGNIEDPPARGARDIAAAARARHCATKQSGRRVTHLFEALVLLCVHLCETELHRLFFQISKYARLKHWRSRVHASLCSYQ